MLTKMTQGQAGGDTAISRIKKLKGAVIKMQILEQHSQWPLTTDQSESIDVFLINTKKKV